MHDYENVVLVAISSFITAEIRCMRNKHVSS